MKRTDIDASLFERLQDDWREIRANSRPGEVLESPGDKQQALEQLGMILRFIKQRLDVLEAALEVGYRLRIRRSGFQLLNDGDTEVLVPATAPELHQFTDTFGQWVFWFAFYRFAFAVLVHSANAQATGAWVAASEFLQREISGDLYNASLPEIRHALIRMIYGADLAIYDAAAWVATQDKTDRNVLAGCWDQEYADELPGAVAQAIQERPEEAPFDWIRVRANSNIRRNAPDGPRGGKRRGRNLPLDEVAELGADDPAFGAVEAAERDARIHEAVARLGGRMQQVMQMRLEGHDTAAIAAALRVEEATVRVVEHRARRKLAEMLADIL